MNCLTILDKPQVVVEPAVEPDKYDKEIGKLLHILERYGRFCFRAAMYFHWYSAAPLFQFCSPSGSVTKGVGCLTMVRSGHGAVFGRDDLTVEIRNDNRIPLGPGDAQPKQLFACAEWQRRLDKELGR